MKVFEGSYYDQGTLSYRAMAMCLVFMYICEGSEWAAIRVFSRRIIYRIIIPHKNRLMLSNKIFLSISCKRVYLECVIVSQGGKLWQYSCFQ